MAALREVVITGLGVVSPIGIGHAPFWTSMVEQRSGIRPVTLFDTTGLPVRFAGEAADFDPKLFVQPRKSLKVMSRDIQLGVAAANLAMADSGLAEGQTPADRFGVVFGADMMYSHVDELGPAYRACLADGPFDMRKWGARAFDQVFPLWMLRHLPNMTACHIGIAHDARGANNTIVLGEVSSLLAIAEAARVIARGTADLMIAGGASTQLHPTMFVRMAGFDVSHRNDAPQSASRPFDKLRDGAVYGEGAAAFVLEERAFAEARGARVWARLLGAGNAFEAPRPGRPSEGRAIRRAIELALRDAGMNANDVGHANAHGLSTRTGDAVEAAAIRAVLGDVPVTAPKSYFGHLGAGGGAVEFCASVLALANNLVPPTLNYERPDPACPINVVANRPLAGTAPTAVALNTAATGQSAAIVIGR